MTMHEVPYVATATLSHLEDYAQKLIKAKEKSKKGFSYLHVFCPCLVGWKIPMDASIQVCRTAVRTNYFPLWEYEDGQYRFTKKTAKPKPVKELTKLIGKFKHLKQEDQQPLQTMVDRRYKLVETLCEGTAA